MGVGVDVISSSNPALTPTIKLYTKEPFIYFILNQALRKQNIEVIVMMGFFTQTLNCYLTVRYLCEELSETTVYRGQGMPAEDLENIKQTENGLLSFNNFLSQAKIEKYPICLRIVLDMMKV